MAAGSVISEGAVGSARPAPRTERLLVLDTAYTLEMIRQRRAERSILCRDLDGYFDHVWNVHPFATLLTSDAWGPRFGRPDRYELSPRHTVIEGRIGRFGALRRLFPLNFLLSQAGLFLQLRKLVKREGITAIRAGDPLYLGLFARLLARTTGAAFTIRVNGNNERVREVTGKPIFPRLFRSSSRERRVERSVFPRADLVFAPNEDNAGFAAANGVPRERIKVVNFGSLLGDEHFVEPTERADPSGDLRALGLAPGAFLLSVGRLMPAKYPDHLIETLATARQVRPDLKLLFAGDGEMKGELEALATRLGVADAVVFAGNLDQQLLARILPTATAFMSPSTGRALSEAALGGAPVVAYDFDWQKDMVETDVTGILVPYQDQAAMAEGLIRYLRDPAFAASMGRAVRRRALAMLDPAAGIAREREAYQRMFARRRGEALA